MNTPSVSVVGGDVCPGNTLPTLDAGNPGSQYQWNTGETSQTISPTAPGTYTVTVTNTGGGISCTGTGTASVNFYPDVVVSLGNEQIWSTLLALLN